MSKGACVFCKIIEGKIPAKIVFEDPELMAFEDAKPQAPVHILLIPKEHIEKTSDLTTNNAGIVSRLMLTAADIARKRNIQESGYRIVFNCNKDAGQEVFHLHMHLLGGRPFKWPPG